MEKVLGRPHTALEAAKESIPFSDGENEHKPDRYEFNPKTGRFHDTENSYRFVSTKKALAEIALGQVIEKPVATPEKNDATSGEAIEQAGVAEITARRGMDLKYIKSVVEEDIRSGDIDAMRETTQDISTLIDNNLEDGKFTDETLYLDALRTRLLDAMVGVSKTDSNPESTAKSDNQDDASGDESTPEPAVVYGPSIDELTTSGSDDGEGEPAHDSDDKESEDGEDPGAVSEEGREVPELNAGSLRILKDINLDLYDMYEAARDELIKVHADERGSDFAGLLDDASGRYGLIGWARKKLGKRIDKLSNRRLEATKKYDEVFIKARDEVIAEYDKLTPMTDEQKIMNEMLIDASAAERLEYDISKARIAIDESKSPMNRRLSALTAVPIAALAGGLSAIADGDGRGGSDHPSLFWGTFLGSAVVGSVGFAQSFKTQAGHINSEEAIAIRAQKARSRVINVYEESSGGMRGRVESTNAVGGITSEIQDEKYKKKRNAAIGGAALGGVAAAATAGGVHYAGDQTYTYHDAGVDLYAFDGKVDLWDGDSVDVWGGDFLPEGNADDKATNLTVPNEPVAASQTEEPVEGSRPEAPDLGINLDIYDRPGWDLNPFDGNGIDPNPFGEGALRGEAITIEITSPPEPDTSAVEQSVQEPVAPAAGEPLSPAEGQAERALYVNPGNGISHEIMDDAESHGIYVSPERAGEIAEQVENLGAENILEGQTLYPQNDSLRIENAGPDKWTHQEQQVIYRHLDTNGDGTLNELDNEVLVTEPAGARVGEVTFYQNDGFSDGL